MSGTATLRPCPATMAGPGATRTPRIRHGFLAGGLLVVAGLRAATGDWLWAALLGLAAVTETTVWVLERRAQARDAATAATHRPEPDARRLAVSLRAHRQARNLWGVVLAVTLVAGVALVATSPTMAAVVAVVALLSLARLRRERRTVKTLSRVVV